MKFILKCLLQLQPLTLAILFMHLASPQKAWAEYRAYELLITNTATNQSRVVVTTLDDIQYVGYFHLLKDERLVLQATWMCWSRSERFRAICPKPNQ